MIIYLVLGVGGVLIGYRTGIGAFPMMHIANYLEVFLILTIIHDLLPAFKLFFSIIASIEMAAIFMGTSMALPQPIGMISCLVGVVYIIMYNLFLYKKKNT